MYNIIIIMKKLLFLSGMFEGPEGKRHQEVGELHQEAG